MTEVYILSGFLGSGKTSLLTGLIMQAKKDGLKPGVIMNELGELAFDSEAVEEGVPLKEILNGCICCTGSEKTESQMQALLHEDVDIIFIETTGAAHPVEVLDAVHSPLFGERLDVKGIVTVADGKRYLASEGMTPQVRMLFLEQIRHAGFVLLNKSDLLTDSEKAEAVMGIQALNPGARIVETVNSKVPLAALRSLAQKPTGMPVQKAGIGSHLPIGTRLVTFSKPVSRETFEGWIRTLPETVYRMKGYVPLEGNKYPSLFQYAYGMVQWIPEYMNMPANLVLIGEGLSEIHVPGTGDE
ncbi:cobalamin biosynthesis protein [Bhargavaea cecembensis]|uniref:Cobalamin biosynthesis protein n=1 Tax=Bhargavaea cecembensis TaxID=394098 RepID=A0A165HJQ2_9BACL|nr:GTP-binding protein [Bhargavaea cecembensis]KZE40219.1 cobalamin biosynthesis protein [Bhargavaea cecembensis]